MKKIIFSVIFAILVVTGVALSDYFPDVIVTSPNGIWTDTRAYSTIDAAVTAIGANERDLYVISQETTTALTIPSNINLHFRRNGSIANTGQLTLQTTSIDAPNKQIFTGTGNIDFANGTVLKSGWFANIESAFALTVNDTVTLLVTKPQSITANYSPGNNVNLRWESPGNILTVNAGVEVGNLKMIEAGNYQIFAGSGDFDFLDGTKLKLSWFNRLRSVLNWVESEEVTIIVDGENGVNYTQAITANELLDFKSSNGSFNIAAGVVFTYFPSNIIAGGAQTIFTGLGTAVTPGGGTIYAYWYDGATVSHSIQAILDAHDTDYGVPLDIVITQTTDGGEAWGSEVNVDRDAHFTLHFENGSEGRVYASAAIDRFLDIGIEQKLNISVIENISFDAYDQDLTEAIRLASSSRSRFDHLNLIASHGGSLVNGFMIDPTAHTGAEGSSGFVGCVWNQITTAGTGITGALIYSKGGQIETTIENIHTADGCKAVQVYNSAGKSFQSNTIRDISGDSGSSDALVDLDTGDGDSISENNIYNIKGSGKYGVKITQRGTSFVQRNKVIVNKDSDWDTQALYVYDNPGAAESYRGTYIRMNKWGNGPELDAGCPITFQVYTGAAWSDNTGNVSIRKSNTTEGLSIYDETNGTIWTYQAGTWHGSPIRIIQTVGDDVAYRIAIPTELQSHFHAKVIAVDADSSKSVSIMGRVETSAYCDSIYKGSNSELTTGILLGTTGTDGKLVVSCHTDGYLYIENRTGYSRSILIEIT